MQHEHPLRRYLIEITCSRCQVPFHAFETMCSPDRIQAHAEAAARSNKGTGCTCGHDHYDGHWYAEPDPSEE